MIIDMKKENPNIQVDFQGIRYNVRKTAIRTYTYGENKGQKHLRVGPTEAGQMTKQYVKHLNKEYLCKVRAEHFSMGNSVNVYVTYNDGSSIPKEDFDKIRNFVEMFQYGKFNGMIDMYENHNTTYKTDNGNHIEGGCKYTHVSNQPQFGTVEWIVNEVKNVGRTIEDATRYISNKKIVERAMTQL